MPSRFVLQPDLKLAVFSSVIDDFTHYDLTEAEALEYGTSQWGSAIAGEKIASALADRIEFGNPPGDGLGRWREALTDIAAQHGLSTLRTTLTEIGFPEAEIPQDAFDIVKQIEADDEHQSRQGMEAEYRNLISAGPITPPGIANLSDETLRGKLTLLRAAAAAAEEIRRSAAPRVARLREEQAVVLSSEDSARSWMDDAMSNWDGKGASAFHPFSAAVDLCRHPLPGLKAAADRYEDARREWLLSAVSAYEVELSASLPTSYEAD
ncbi:hypothetical protein G6L37_06955 [Agrobacterium rubi]|nr:hypothetical protein [Agrobacterium rubi]NTF25104.1 hypothetical protein [Agrobacterium rubi]